MTSGFRTAVTCLLLWFVVQGGPCAAEGGEAYIELDGRRVPKSLLSKISVDLRGVPLEQALRDISDQGGFRLSFNRSRVPVGQTVTITMVDRPAVEVLIHLLEKTDTELLITPDGQLAVVPAGNRSPTRRPKGSIKGRVLDTGTQAPLEAASVTLMGPGMGAATDSGGGFAIGPVPVGSYSVQVSRIGYMPVVVTDVVVRPRRITQLPVELTASPIELETLVVSEGYFPEAPDQPTGVIHLSAEEVRRSPGSLGDVSRIIYGLPSIAKVNDSFSSLYVRGGSPSENGFYVDHIELPSISHYPVQGTSGGFLGLVNVDLIRDVEFYTGGFSAAYGDKLSSVMDLSLREGNREELDVQLDMHFAGVGGGIVSILVETKRAPDLNWDCLYLS